MTSAVRPPATPTVTTLTAVDTAITLLEEGPGRRVVMVSRHGRLPFAHIAQQSTAWVSHVPDGPLTAWLHILSFTDRDAAAVHFVAKAELRAPES